MRLLVLVQRGSQLGATETPRRATSRRRGHGPRRHRKVGADHWPPGCKRLEPESDSPAQLARVSSGLAPSRASERPGRARPGRARACPLLVPSLGRATPASLGRFDQRRPIRAFGVAQRHSSPRIGADDRVQRKGSARVIRRRRSLSPTRNNAPLTSRAPALLAKEPRRDTAAAGTALLLADTWGHAAIKRSGDWTVAKAVAGAMARSE
jgi:hypothetical protein